MINDYLLEILAISMAFALFLAYIYIRSRIRAKNDLIESDEKLETKSIREVSKTILEPSESKIVPTESVTSEKPAHRRISDKITPKRVAPAHKKITKEHFAEFAGKRILVAEDNPINQKVISGLLGQSGIELVMADDGQDALDILEKDSNFFIILMDAHMPRVDGFQATRIIRQNRSYDHILIVALSGDTASDDIQKMKEAGMDEQLAKPLRMDALYNILYAYSDTHTTEKELVQTLAKELNTAKGLETCGGDEMFYREILQQFINDFGNSAERLGQLLRSNDLASADAMLLDVIGVSENIGAYALGESATTLKLALRDTTERNYFGIFDQYKAQFEQLTIEIESIVKNTLK